MVKAFRQILIVLMLTGAPVLGAPFAGAQEGPQHLQEARAAIEKSAFSQETKSRLLVKAEGAAAAGIPAEDVSVIITRSLNRGVDSRQIEGFLETAEKAKAEGLPVRMVLDRTEQGLAKGVPAEKISGVTRQLAGHLAAARPIVRNLEDSGVRPTRARGSDDAVETVARAFEQSVPGDAVMGVGEKVRERKESLALFNSAVDAMTTFAGSGMPGEQAAKLVDTAVEKGYSERDLRAMERYMADELRKNRPMRDIVSGMNSRMERGEMMRDMRDRPGADMRGPNAGGMGGMGGMSGMGGR